MQSIVALIGALAWPVLIGWALWYFRADIRALFPRIRQFGMSGVSVDPLPQQPQAVTPPEAPSSQGIFSEFIASEILKPATETIVQTIPSSVPNTDAARRDFFLHAAATLNVLLAFERTYRAIFGSQIALLKTINEQMSLSVNNARILYDSTARSFPEPYTQAEITFDKWLGFLIGTGLVTREGDKLQLTPFGRGFLRYMVEYRLSENKGL